MKETKNKNVQLNFTVFKKTQKNHSFIHEEETVIHKLNANKIFHNRKWQQISLVARGSSCNSFVAV